MGENVLGLNQVFPIYNADGTPFFGLELKKSTFESSIMSLGDKITGDVYYKDNSLAVTMGEYIEYKNNPEDENERPVEYELVNPPTIVREGMVSDNSELKGMTKYSFVFYHPMYKLGNIPFTDIAVTDSEEKYLSQNKTFAWIGNLFEFIEKIAANLDGTEWGIDYNIQQGTQQWEKASKISKEVLSFDKQFISDALKAAFDEWGIPFSITPYNGQGTVRFIITFGLPSREIYAVEEHGDITQTPYVFRFGQGVGLKNNSRTPRNNKIVTRIVGYGSDRNIPYGYPQIVWHGDQSWDYTIDNDPTNPLSYPIYDGILNGTKVRLIKHPFTRTTLMPSIYHETVKRKVDPLDSHYDPYIQIIDYRDAGVGYPNPISPNAPSVEIHQFEDIYPRLVDSHGESYEIEDFNIYDEKAIQYITWNNFVQYVNTLAQNAINEKEANMLRNLPTTIEESFSEYTEESIEGSYIVKYEYRKDDTFVYVKYVSDTAAFDKIVLRQGKSYDPTLVDEIDDDGKYKQSYFTVTLPILDFDLYACASITEKMDINMRSGACIGCTFPVQVDWEDYQKNFYDADGKFDPVIGEGHPRNGEKYPDSSQERITLILQKETETFGVIMPNIYQYPHSGDAFVILGISLPQSYIENAEVELEDAMMEYMLENNVYYFDYPLKFDEYFLAKNNKILAQIKNNSIVRFQYAGTEMALYVKQITVKFGEGVLPQYDITLTDDVEIVLNQIGQVTDDVSRMRVQLSELQKYYSENLINAINDKLSRTVDDICNGRITFQQGIDVIGATLFHDSLQSPDFTTGMYDGHGWRIDNLGNAEFESIRVRSFLEVVELIVNRLQAQEGDTLFTDNDQIDFVQRVENEQHEISYILSLKEKYDGYITAQKTGNIIKGIINTLAANQAGVSQYDDSDAVETDGDNTYFTSWMRVVEDSNTSGSTLKTNQIRVALYGDNDTPAGKNFVPCELMTIARWGCYLDPNEEGISNAEKQSRIRRQRMFSISVTDGRVTKYTKVNKPIIEDTSFGVTIGELPEFVKNYSAVRSVLNVVGEHTDWLYAQGIVVGNFIKVDINGVPEVSYIDCGTWVNGGQIPSPSPRNGIYLCNEWNEETQQYETHDVWHNNAKWRCNQHQPIVIGGTTTYYEPTENSQYWTKLEEGVAGETVKTVTVFKMAPSMPATPTGSTIPPMGWSTMPPASDIQETSVSGDFTDASGDHTGWREANGNHEDNAFIKDTITFTTELPNQVIFIEIQASSENGYDFIFVGNLDQDYTQRPSSMPTGRYASGTNRKIIDTVVATVGTHTIQVIYTKDGSKYENEDKGWYRVIPNNNIWASVATFVNNNLSGTWSTPVRWNGDDGTSVTIASTEIKYQVSNSGTEVPSSTWQTTIPTVGDGQYLWTRTIVTYSDGTSTISYSVSRNGINGTSPIVASLSNDIDSVACTNDMKTLVATNLYSKVSLHKGTTDITSASQIKYVTKPTNATLYLESSGSGTSGSSLGTSYTTIGNNQYVRVRFSDNVALSSEQNVVLMVKNDSVELQLVFTILGVKGSSVYSLVPSANVISKNIQDEYTPSIITCKSTKLDVLSGVTTENPSGATIKYTKDGGSTEYAYNTGLTAGTDFNSYVVFLLYVGGNVVDKETVNIVSDGQDGEDGKDASQVRPNMLLRTVFEQGLDKIAEAWNYDARGVSWQTAANSKTIMGRQTLRLNSTAIQSNLPFTQSILGKLKAGTWYTFSFYCYCTRSFNFYIQNRINDTNTVIYDGNPIVDGVEYTGFDLNNSVTFDASWAQKFHTITFKTNSDISQTTLVTGFYLPYDSSKPVEDVQVLVLCMPKLEEGDSATAYMANEDDLKGSNGVRGKVGRFYYYAGEFDVSDSTHTFVVNDAQAPYFKTGQLTYHVYNAETNGSYTMAQMGDNFNNEPWEVMTNDFKYLITEAIFGSYAHFGSFIISGDWMISQNGRIDGVDSNDYTKFDANFPSSPLLCNEVNVGFYSVNVCQNTFTANKTYNIQITASNFHRTSDTAAYQLNAQMYNGTSTVGSKITITSDGTYTLSFTPTSTGVYYLRCNMQNSGTFCDVSANVTGLFIPTFSVDGLTGKSYQNDLTIRGRMYSPYTRITSMNHTQYEMTDQFGDTVLDIGKTGFNIQNEYFSGNAYLPAITQDMLGCEINILNMKTSSISIASRNHENSRVVCKSISGTGIANTNVDLTFMEVAKIKAIELPSTYSEYGQYAWVCIEKREITVS